jgi:MerR family transcriptional regulator/heat shock protein HspR
MPKQRRDEVITIRVAARRTQLAPRTVRRYTRRGLVDDLLTEGDLAELRRIRQLTGLGVNLAGVEVILHMRRKMQELQAEIRRWDMLDITSDR